MPVDPAARFGDGIHSLIADGPTATEDDLLARVAAAREESRLNGGVITIDADGNVIAVSPELAATADDDQEDAALRDAARAHPLSSLAETDRRKADAANEITDPDALAALVASALETRGGLPALLAKRTADGLTASVGPDGTVTPAAWHAHSVVEGIRTDDHREFAYGSVQLPDLPVSLRLLLEDEGGHWGAVTCGRIDTIVPVDITPGVSRFYDSAGMFGSDPNGQLAELMVEEQTQRFVSVDPRGDVSAEWIEVLGGTTIVVDGIEIPVGGDDDYDCWWRFSNYPMGGQTIVSIPAFPQCSITLASVALPDAPVAMETAPEGLPDGAIVVVVAEDDDDDEICEVDDDDDDKVVVIISSAATDTVGPPAVFFDDPGFHLGDDRLVLQSDGESYACPLTIGDPDPDTGFRRIFGHFAWWNCDHTGFPGQQIKPPHSASGYAYFNLGQGVDCAAGARVSGVGRITMGTGHAPLSKIDNGKARNLSVAEVQAHYDGGYGALTAAYVKAGEDEFGPWVAGYVNPQLSATELRDLMTLNLSGDWRDIADNLEALAVLAVPVPGFPIRRQMTASGAPEVRDFDTRASFTGDRPVALVAAGIVWRVSPEARLVRLEMDRRQDRAEIDSLKALVASMRREQYGI